MFDKFILPCLIALQFLTKFPIQLPKIPTAQQNAYSILFYPVVGGVIGGILWLMAYYLPLPILAKGAMITALWLWLTGGLHMDGLADMTDGFVGGYGDKERTLAIMKDPHSGAMGVMAMVGVLLCKCAFVVALLEIEQYVWLIWIPIMGRLSLLGLLLTTPYVRVNGLGSALSQYLPKRWVIVVLLLGLLSSLWIVPMSSAMILMVIWLMAVMYFRWWFIRRIGGITGDTLGASVEMMECIGLLVGVWITFAS